MPTLAELYVACDSDPGPIVEFIQSLAESYDLPRPLSVLDAGCGPGRMLAPLERLRWDVTGLEPNLDFFEAARQHESRRVRVRRGGFLDIEDDEAFDLVLAVNSAFAHLLAPAERIEALTRIHGALRPGGVVFLDLPNFLWILKNYRDPHPFEFTLHGQPLALHRRHHLDVHDATFVTTDRYLTTEGIVTETLVHAYGIVTLPEILHHLNALGFTEVRTFNRFASRASEHLDGPRMMVAARKPSGS